VLPVRLSPIQIRESPFKKRLGGHGGWWRRGRCSTSRTHAVRALAGDPEERGRSGSKLGWNASNLTTSRSQCRRQKSSGVFPRTPADRSQPFSWAAEGFSPAGREVAARHDAQKNGPSVFVSTDGLGRTRCRTVFLPLVSRFRIGDDCIGGLTPAVRGGRSPIRFRPRSLPRRSRSRRRRHLRLRRGR